MGYDRTTVEVGVLQNSDGDLLTVVSTNSYRRAGIIRPLAQRAGYLFVSGGGHAEENIIENIISYAAREGWDVLAPCTSRPGCIDCAGLMRSLGFSGSTGISLSDDIATSMGGFRNIMSWWR